MTAPNGSSSAYTIHSRIFLALILLVTFHKITEYGERMGSLGRVDPALAQWLPFLGFILLSLWLYRILAYRPGGQPIGALDRWFAMIGSAVSGLAARLVRRENWRDDVLSAG